MKITKWILFIALGTAFLAVSLWVFLSGGKNAKAINAKYRVGGMMLSVWALLSSSTCSNPNPMLVTCYDTPNPDPEIMCYEPAIEEQTSDFARIALKGKDLNNDNKVKAGDVFMISIRKASYSQYVFKIGLNDGTPLQQTILTIPEGAAEEESVFEVPVADNLSHEGLTIAEVKGVEQADPLTLTNTSFATVIFMLE